MKRIKNPFKYVLVPEINTRHLVGTVVIGTLILVGAGINSMHQSHKKNQQIAAEKKRMDDFFDWDKQPSTKGEKK